MRFTNTRLISAAALFFSAVAFAACSRDVNAMTPEEVAQRYGITDAYAGEVTTADGATLRGTLVPITLSDGRPGQLVITGAADEPHSAYILDHGAAHPIELEQTVTRQQVVQRPVVVQQRAERPHAKKRSWEKEALIIGGSAAGGAAIGAVAGGKKGAAVGATAGGIGGLIYDLATRNK